MPATPLRSPRIRGSVPPSAGRGQSGTARGVVRQTQAKATSLLRDPFRIGILILLVDTISKTTGEIPAAQLIRPSLLIFCGCAFYAVLNFKKSVNLEVFHYRVPQLILLQAALACGSALFGISMGHAAYYILTNYWKTLAVALLLIVSLRNLSDVRRMIWATALAGVLLSFISVFITHLSKQRGGAVYDANDVSTIVVMTVPLTLFAAQTTKGIWRILCIAGLVLCAETIVISGSRGAFFGIVAVGAALLLFLPGISPVKRVMYVGGIAATLAIFAPEGYWESMQSIVTNPTADYNWDAGMGRRQIAKRGIGYMMDHPFFGLGIDNFSMQEGMYSDYAKELMSRNIGVKWTAPHNSWVEAGAETGIPGLLVWVALVVGSTVPLIRLRRKMPASWARDGTPDQRFVYLATLYVPISILGFVVCATFVSFAWSDQSYVLPAIAMGIQMACVQQFGLTVGTPARRPVARGRRATLGPNAV
jgi:O-antigen ligase